MPTEIERRFLIADPDELRRRATRARPIEQGYLAIDPDGTQVRVRRIGDEAVLTVKRGSGEVRLEQEIPVPRGAYASLWELTEGRRVVKDRHYVEAGGDLVYEGDVYHGALAGLAVVEVEFRAPEDSGAFRPPDWFGRELTGDDRYSNANLAVHGMPAEEG
jgi:CYTH domain-containing protein